MHVCILFGVAGGILYARKPRVDYSSGTMYWLRTTARALGVACLSHAVILFRPRLVLALLCSTIYRLDGGSSSDGVSWVLIDFCVRDLSDGRSGRRCCIHSKYHSSARFSFCFVSFRCAVVFFSALLHLFRFSLGLAWFGLVRFDWVDVAGLGLGLVLG